MAKRRNRSKNKKLKRLQELQKSQQSELLAAQRAIDDKSASDYPEDDSEDEFSDEKVLSRSEENIRAWYDYFSPNLEQYKDDMGFALGSQWDTFEQAIMVVQQKTNLVFNKVYDYIRRVIGYQRKNTVVPQLRAKDFAAKEEDITLRANLLRSIYQDSDGKSVEQIAASCALMGGFGVGWIDIDYAHSKTSKQIVKWRVLRDPLLAFFDPLASHPTKRDGRFCGYYEVVSKKDILKDHPEATTAEIPPMSGNSFFSWNTPKDSMLVVYYCEKREIATELYTLDDGSEIYKEEYDANPEIQFVSVVNKRPTKRGEVWCYKRTAHQILEKYKFPVEILPGVFCDGDSHYIEGQQKTFSLVYHAKDPQRFYNYLMSEVADDIKKGRKEQWVGTPANIQQNSIKQMWQNVEQRQGLLVADYDEKGNLPTKQAPDEIRQSLLQAIPAADSNIQASLGMFSANQGDETNATSGVAYQQQAMLGAATTAVYFDNLNKFTAQMGAITVALMPYVYDSERYVGLIDEQGKYSTKAINNHPSNFIEDVGQFDVTIELAPSLEFEKEQAVKLLIDIAQLPPETLARFGDLIAANINAENTPQIVKRLQMFVDPAIIAKENGQPPPPVPPNPMEQMMQAQIGIEQAKLQQNEEEIQGKREERMLSMREKQIDGAIQEQKLMLEAQKQEIALQTAQIKANAEIEKAFAEQQQRVISLLEKLATFPREMRQAVAGG